MSIGKPEKIAPHEKAGSWKRDAKRAIVKALRQGSKKDPENAPKKGGYRGWSS